MRILIADDHHMVRRGVGDLLSKEAGWEICGEATDAAQAIQKASELNPDLVLLDISLPDGSGLEAARRIHREFPDSHILILTLHDVPELTKLAQTAGAQGLVLKSDSDRLLIAAVEHLGRTDTFYSYKSSSSFANPLI